MLKLIYFKMRALAEAPQLLLNYSGVEYEYAFVTFVMLSDYSYSIET